MELSGEDDVDAVSNATCQLLRQLYLPDGPAAAISGSGRLSGVEGAKRTLQEVVNPALCVVGIVGNSMNVVVMTRRRLRTALDSNIETAARLGLLALTVADILCCFPPTNRFRFLSAGSWYSARFSVPNDFRRFLPYYRQP